MASNPVTKAIRTAKWAVTMTKWFIAFQTGGKRFRSARVRPAKRWQLAAFPGPAGRESSGIVDLIAIRRDHRTSNSKVKPGDFFETILIQVKGGGAKNPTKEDVRRLREVAKRYHAKAVVLAVWRKGGQPEFFRLNRQSAADRNLWLSTDSDQLFR